MKYLRFAWLCLLCVSPIQVWAQEVNGIDILSSVYSVSGTWSYTWTCVWQAGNPANYIYSSGSGYYGGSSSDGSPISGQLTAAGYPFPPGLAFPGVDGSFSID